MFLKLGIGCFPLCISIGNTHIRTSIYINTADCYLAVDGYLVGEINKQLSSKAGVDDEGARGLQAEKDWKAVWVCFTCCEQRQTDSDSAIQEEPLPTGLDRTRARETSWVLICRVWVSLWNRTWGHKWEPCLKVSLFTSISIDLCTLSSSFK